MIDYLENTNEDINKNLQPQIAGLYARVSTGRQEKEETIDSQLDEIKARITADGNSLPEENIFQDDGWTGEMLVRPGLDSMRDAASDEKFEILYVYDRGRLSRIFAYQEVIIEDITNKGIEFVTLHDLAANTPEEHVLQAMQGVFHQYERVKITERFRRGKLHKARNGILINGSALYGYNYVKKTDKEPTHYEINEDETRVIRMIYQWVGIERLSIYEVRRRLFQNHIPPRKGKQLYWTRGPIIRLLRNASYVTGEIYYNKSEAIVAKRPLKHDKYKKIKRTSRRIRSKDEWIPYHITPILENNGLFERVQKVLDYYKKYQPKNKKYDYLLSGLVWCECGERRVGDGYTHNHYYRCIERIKKFPLLPVNCKSHGVNAVILDGLLWQKLQSFLSDKKLLKEQAKIWLKDEFFRSSTSTSEKNRLETLLNQAKEEELRYARAFGNGTIEEDQLKILISEIKKKIMRYQAQINEIEPVKIDYSVDDNKLNELCGLAKKVIESNPNLEKKKIIQDLLDKVTIFEEGKVRVDGHIPQFAQYMGYEFEHRYRRTSKRR